MSTPRPRIFIYTPEIEGAPGLELALVIARGFFSKQKDASILLASDCESVGTIDLPTSIEIVRLPSLRTSELFAELRPDPESGSLSAGIHSFRESMLHESVRNFDPHLVLILGTPMGSAGEFERSIELIRAQRPSAAIAIGVLDTLGNAEQIDQTWKSAESVEAIQHVDLILVFGQQELFDPLKDFDFPNSVKRKTRFTGYIRPMPSERDASKNPGTHGRGIRIALFARERSSAELLISTTLELAREWDSKEQPFQIDLLIGPGTETHAFRLIAADLRVFPSVRRITERTEFSAAIRDADVVITDGNYSDVIHAVSAGKKPVIAHDAKLDASRSVRALRFEELGLVIALACDDLSSATLENAVKLIVDERVSPPDILRFDGLGTSCEALITLLGTIPELWQLQRLPAARLNLPVARPKSTINEPNRQDERIIEGWDGTRFHIREGDFIESQIERYGAFEFEDHIRMLALLRTGDNVIDGGANIGCHTCPMATRVAPYGRVLAIEPVPRIATRLEANLRLNGIENVDIHQVVLGSEAGIARIYLPDTDDPNQGNSSVFRQREFPDSWIDVPRITIDELVQESRLSNVRLIKLDLEGLDYEGLLGAENTIRRFRPYVVVEFHRELWKRAGYSFRDLDRFLRVDHAYRVNPWKKDEEIITVFARP